MTTNPIGRIAAASWVLASLAHAQQQKVHPLLDRLNQEQFTPTVYKVTDQVYSAVGFSLANCILIAGSDGIVMVDTTEDRETGEKVLAEFRKIANLPVRAVIYTHNHGDHTGGVRAFVPENAAGQIDIYAHESLNDEVVNTSSVV
ncbi:MAG: MBL fold metallo-hydrolase, partial [Acidobacteria bacterium]|nr:MBL fold metallo-hydrolase [Acidobacteriota bacterium]